MKMVLYHGTNQRFDRFDPNPAYRATHGASATSGIFLTTLPQIAEQYAACAFKALASDDHSAHEARIADLICKADRMSAAGRWDEHERLMIEAEEAEALVRDQTSGARVLEVEIETVNPLILEDVGRIDLHDMKILLDQAFENGHDAVVMENIWDPGRIEEVSERYDHVVVRDPDLIRILSVREIVMESEDDLSMAGP